MGSKRKRSSQEAPAAAPVAKKQQKTTNSTKHVPELAPIDTSPFLDDPKGADRKRQADLYNLLGDEDGSQRIVAADAYLKCLLGGEGVAESTLKYHLNRLFGGLATSRKGSRLGYSIVLAEVLGQLFGSVGLVEEKYPGLTFDTALEILVHRMRPDGDASGKEKEHALGLLFGLQSFVQAKILFEKDETWIAILDKLFELAKKKPWIREECGWVIVQALEQMNQAQAELTLNKLYDEGLALSPEGVGIWITAKNRFADMKAPSKPWGQSGNPLEHLKSLAKALKESSANEDKGDKIKPANQTGSWNPQLHFVWNIVLAQFAKAAQANTHGIKSEFENFWKVTVDENLFSGSASRERKFWGFLVFQKVLQDASSYEKLLPSVFSHNLVRCLINSVQEKDRFLNRAADKSLKTLVQMVETQPKTLVAVLPNLIDGNGNYNFDRITKTKTVDKLLSFTNDTNAEAVIEILLKPVLVVEDSDDVKDAESRRQMFGDYLLTVIRRFDTANEPSNNTWVKTAALPKLADFAYGNTLKFQPPLSEKTRTLFRNRLSSAFAHLLSDLEGYHYSCDLLISTRPDAIQMDDDITDAKNRAISTMEKILKKVKKTSNKDQAPLQALALLYSLVIFQLYNGDSESLSVLDELKLCYDKLIRRKDSVDSDAEASEVLVELLLSFIAKPSILLRKATQHVFSAFVGEITAGGLKLMTDVLESSESLKGQQELFDQEPEQGDEMDVDGSDDDLDSDVEVIDTHGANGHTHDSDEEDDDEDEEEEQEEDEAEDDDDEEAQKLDDALAEALGTHRLDQDEKEEESDSDADMSDSEMMALDSKLVEIFSQRKKHPNKKQEKKDAKETMVNFKSRILDLLEVFVKKQATNSLAFGLLLPLLQLIRTTKTPQLAERAKNIIVTFAKASKGAKKEVSTDFSTSEQIKLMKAIHTEATKDQSHVLAKAASTASLLIASSLYRMNKDTAKKIATVYRDSQTACLEGEVKMQPVFWVDWANWVQSQCSS